MDLKTARLRSKAKRFKAQIPAGLAIPIPVDMVDSIADDEIREFFETLRQLGLKRNNLNPGYWERID